MDQAADDVGGTSMLRNMETLEEQTVELVEAAGNAMSAIGSDQWDPAALSRNAEKYLALVQSLQQGVEKHITLWEEQGADGVGGSLYGTEKDAKLSTDAVKLVKERVDRLCKETGGDT